MVISLLQSQKKKKKSELFALHLNLQSPLTTVLSTPALPPNLYHKADRVCLLPYKKHLITQELSHFLNA